MRSRSCWAALSAAGLLFIGASAGAADNACIHLTRANLVPCTLAASLSVESEQKALDAARGREAAARPILPSNPSVELALGSRRAPTGDNGTFWSARLSQEVEIGGQRGLRRDEAGAMTGAQSQRLLQARREVAAEAWLSYFELAAATEQQSISERFETISQQVKDAAKATASNGLLSPVDADLAEMSWSQARQAAVASRAVTTQAKLRLTALLGGVPGVDTPSIASDLEPVRDVEAFARRSLSSQAPDLPEVRALALDQQALRHHATLLRRSRVPNLTFAAFLERDTFEGRLVGGALSIPIPLPEPLGRTASGEIAESEALASRADSELRLLKRASRLRVAQGLAELDAKRQELAALDDAQVARALRTLDALAAEVWVGRMGVRDALLSQERLIGFLRARADAEHALAEASVTLAQASGFPLERSGS